MESSPISSMPAEVIATTVGYIPRMRSGPPVPTSSSAASKRASIATFCASEELKPCRYRFLSDDRASFPPEPVAW